MAIKTINIITTPVTIKKNSSKTFTVPSYSGKITKIIINATKNGNRAATLEIRNTANNVMLASFKNPNGVAEKTASVIDIVKSIELKNTSTALFNKTDITVESLQFEVTETSPEPEPAKKTLNISYQVSPAESGTASGMDSIQVTQNQKTGTGNISASPAQNCLFTHWTTSNNSVPISNKNAANTSFTCSYDSMPKQVIFTAYFRTKIFQLNVTAGTGGTVKPGSQQIEVPKNPGQISLSASPNNGYIFKNWTKDGIQVSTSPTYTFKYDNKIQDGATFNFVANFEKQAVQTKYFYLITKSSPANGGSTNYSTKKTLELTAGNIQITAAPAYGYVFSHWTSSKGGTKIMENPYTYDYTPSTVQENETVTYTANFEKAAITQPPISFKKGVSSALPTTRKEGTLYLTTDTHELYYDDTDNRFLVNGSQKFLPLSGGTLTGNLTLSKNLILQSLTKATAAGKICVIDNSGYVKYRTASEIRTDIGAATSGHNHDDKYLALTGGTLTGNLTGQNITGTWLRTTAVTNLNTTASRVAVLRESDGYIYYRTAAQIRTDIGAAASSHNHDDRYFTETEITSKLANYPSKTGTGASGTWNIDISGTASQVALGNGTANASRNIWFSDNGNAKKMGQNSEFQYNPSTGILKVGSIVRGGKSVSWGGGRDGALVRTNTLPKSSYCPIISAKTKLGSWEIGTYDEPTYYSEKLIFSYVKDSDYNGNKNVATSFTLDPTGKFSGSINPLILTGPGPTIANGIGKNPRITFQEDGAIQPVHIVYTDHDAYRAPAGLKVMGGASATPAWFEVEGECVMGKLSTGGIILRNQGNNAPAYKNSPVVMDSYGPAADTDGNLSNWSAMEGRLVFLYY